MQCKYFDLALPTFTPSSLITRALHFRFQYITMWKVPTEAMLPLTPGLCSCCQLEILSYLLFSFNNSVELCSFHLFQGRLPNLPIHSWITYSLSLPIETSANFYPFSLPYYIIITSWCLSASKWGLTTLFSSALHRRIVLDQWLGREWVKRGFENQHGILICYVHDTVSDVLFNLHKNMQSGHNYSISSNEESSQSTNTLLGPIISNWQQHLWIKPPEDEMSVLSSW